MDVVEIGVVVGVRWVLLLGKFLWQEAHKKTGRDPFNTMDWILAITLDRQRRITRGDRL